MLSEETKQRALRVLERRDVSRKELVTKLTDKGVSPEEAGEAADWLERLGVVDDARYAGIVVRHYMAKGYGKARIQNELYRHGIGKELWEEALSQYREPKETIDRLLRAKLKSAAPDRAELKKATDALLRRGFSWREISAAKDRVLGRRDDEESIEIEEF